MEILTVVLIGALFMGGFMIIQDYFEVEPSGVFSFSSFFYAGIIIVIGASIIFCVTLYKRRHRKTIT